MEVGEVSDRLGEPDAERVEDPDGNAGMAVQRGQYPVQTRYPVVIDQQPDAHAALGGGVQGLKQQRPGTVAVPDVILKVERRLGRAHQQEPRGEGVEAVAQQVQPGASRMSGGLRRGRPGQAARSRIVTGFAIRAGIARG